jgi:hypothetical protein
MARKQQFANLSGPFGMVAAWRPSRLNAESLFAPPGKRGDAANQAFDAVAQGFEDLATKLGV